MTILEAIKSSVNYPLADSNVEAICIKRGLDIDEELTTNVANSKEYELSYADVLKFVATMVNLNQGGSVTLPSASVLTGTANAIYRKYGETLIGEAENSKPQVEIL